MIAGFNLLPLYNIIDYWQTLFIGASVNGSVGFLATLFFCDFKKHITSRQRYGLYFIALISMIIMPATSHLILKKKIALCTFRVVLNNSVSYFEIKQRQNDSKMDFGKKEERCDSVLSSNKCHSSNGGHDFWTMLWLAGVLFVGFRILAGLYAIRKIVKNSIHINNNCLQEAKKALKINQTIKVVVSSDVTMPNTIGLLRPKIIVPEQCFSWPVERWRAVLFHEMYHIKRHDSFLNLLIQIICALHWYNPLIWIIESHFREEREASCDQFVMKSGIKPYRYAMHLLEIIRGESGFRNVNRVAVNFDGMSKTEKRIRRILGFTISENEGTKYAACLCLLLTGLILSLSIFKVDFIFKENHQTAEIKYENGFVSFADKVNNIEIVNAALKDVPSYWPLGENWDGRAYTYHRTLRRRGIHHGIAIRSKVAAASKIYATADGIVKNVSLLDTSKRFATLTIQHKNHLSTTYSFLTEVIAKPGDIVKKGDLLGKGAGYWTTFSVKYKTESIDPMPFLAKYQRVSK